MTKKGWIRFVAIAAMMLSCGSALADYQLDNSTSSISFVSIKKGIVAEVNHFKTLSGSIADDGAVNVGINLASVETNIPIRNERMQEHLFETARFPVAQVSTSVDSLPAAGESRVVTLDVVVDLHGVKQTLPVTALAVNSGNGITVSSMLPVVIGAGDFGLDAGVEKLREIAKLPGITHAVPVSFVLSFK